MCHHCAHQSPGSKRVYNAIGAGVVLLLLAMLIAIVVIASNAEAAPPPRAQVTQVVSHADFDLHRIAMPGERVCYLARDRIVTGAQNTAISLSCP